MSEDNEADDVSADQQDVDEGIYYPDAIRLPGVSMRVRGAYANGFPVGAIIHSTDGRPNDGENSARSGAAERTYAYFVIGRSGNVYQCFSLRNWGSHAGPTLHPTLGRELSTKLVGIEIVSAGKLRRVDDNRYRPWYNDKPKKNVPRLEDDFTAAEVRGIDAVGSRRAFGYQTAGHYHKFTEAQETALIKLLRWMQQQRPDVFKFENVLGHDECAIDDDGRYGRKTDPGGSLSVLMAEFRRNL